MRSGGPLLSAVIIAFNEEHNLPRCLESLKLGEVVDEIVVVDSGSTDQTVAIAEAAGARVIFHAFEGHIEQKNWAQAQAKGQWILSLDADEALSEALQAALLDWRKFPSPEIKGFEMNRLTNYGGQWVRHSGWYPDRKLRLWCAGSGNWTGVNPHDRMEVRGRVERMQGDLLHYSYYTRQDHLDQIAYFSDIAATTAPRLPTAIIALKAAFQWVKNFLLRGGYRDGHAGWEIARWSAFATWQKYRKAQSRRRAMDRLPQGRLSRLLIVRTDGIGDVVVSLPLAGWVKQQAPDLVVGFCVAEYTAPVVAACPDVDEVVVKGSQGWTDQIASYDAVVFAFPDKEVVRAARRRVPVRIGTGRRWHMAQSMTHRNWDSRRRSGHHEAWHGLRLLDPIRLVPGLARPGRFLPPDEANALASLVHLETPKDVTLPEGLGSASSRTVVVHPGSHGSANNWSLTQYIQCIRELLPARVVVTGTAREGEAMASLWAELEGTDVVNATGQLDLNQLMVLLAKADAVVAGSTGPLHLAAALGTSVVGLYGKEAPVWPERWRPLGTRVKILVAERLNAAGALDLDPVDVVSATQAKHAEE